ncbi:MAG TPA: sulfite dehydrogenase [Gemmatimonadaceae bacterium]|nr:sulfite dehydrogenase [Gemmatimonadaceae bacterium]
MTPADAGDAPPDVPEAAAVAGGDADDHGISRRDLLTGAAGAIGGALLSRVATAGAQGAAQGGRGAAAAAATVQQTIAQKAPIALPDPTKAPGMLTSAVGMRSPFVSPARAPVGVLAGSSLTPLQDLAGTITPADLHFERHHAGVPTIDPSKHTLIIHGLVERPMVFTLDDLKRFPYVSRVHFVECSGNGRSAFKNPKTETMTAQQAAGLSANSEWIGVPLSVLFNEVGAKPEATWFLAEGGDAALLTRSIPVEKAGEDAMVAWAQNGEALRPEQGFPMRLLLPGWEGNTNVKWLRRIELGTQPWMTRWETSVYTDPLANGTARQFSFVMDARSIITSPSHPRAIAKGSRNISGLAWTGRGVITRVEISTDGGKSWVDALLHPPVMPKAYTRFSIPWEWDGKPTILLSRATDETGYVQPTYERLVTARGPGTDYHANHIVGWRVAADGTVFFHGDT